MLTVRSREGWQLDIFLATPALCRVVARAAIRRWDRMLNLNVIQRIRNGHAAPALMVVRERVGTGDSW
jgi:hypothetical protein